MDRSASAAIEKPTKQRLLWSGRNRRIFDALSRISEVAMISLFLMSYHSSSSSSSSGGFYASVELAGVILRRLFCLSSKPLPVFFVGNVIILVVAALSGVGSGKNGRRSGLADDIYEEYVARRRVISARGNTPEASSGPESEKRIVLYSVSGVSIDGGKGSRTIALVTDGRGKNNTRERKAGKFTDAASQPRKGRLAVPGVASFGDGSASDRFPQRGRGRKAVKSTDVSSPRRRVRLALPGAAQEHALEPAATNADVSSVADGHVNFTPKPPSDASINGENDSSIIAAVAGAKNGPLQRVQEAASPRGRGRLVVARDNGRRTVEDMSNEEFNRSVEKYIARTRRLLQEESTREVDTLAGYPRIEHRRTF